jgi:predicted phosphodiesterase
MSKANTRDDYILIIADLHGNWPALEAVLAAEPHATRILCLGDLVHDGPDCAQIVSWARLHLRAGDLVKGNHDEAAAAGSPVGPAGRHGVIPAEFVTRTRRIVPPEGKEFLRTLPLISRFSAGNRRWCMLHGLPRDPLHGYLLKEGDPDRWEAEVRAAEDPGVLLLGHTHRPFLKQISETVIVNPGSVGRPKDGDPRASYAVWLGGTFFLKRIAYGQTDLLRRIGLAFSRSLAAKLSHEVTTGLSFPTSDDQTRS